MRSLPTQTGVLLLAVATGMGLAVTARVAVVCVPQASVTRTVHVPTTFADWVTIPAVKTPAGGIHSYVYGARPPAGTAVSVTAPPLQITAVAGVIVALKAGGVLTVTERVNGHGPPVTVTVKTVVALRLLAVAFALFALAMVAAGTEVQA